MTAPFEHIAYAKLNLEFPTQEFIEEYDSRILPSSFSAQWLKESWEATRELNKLWGMVDPDIYDTANMGIGRNIVERRGRPMWQFNQLMQAQVPESEHPLLKEHALIAGTFARNNLHHYPWKLKEEYQDLKILQWARDCLPFEKITTIHCVSLEPDCFTGIHRDTRHWLDTPNPSLHNGYAKAGHIVVTLNITSGDSPLYWCFDGEHNKVYKADDPVYMCSDYFLHGVPLTKSRRRQIRFNGIPKPEFAAIINNDSIISVPKNIVWDKLTNMGVLTS